MKRKPIKARQLHPYLCFSLQPTSKLYTCTSTRLVVGKNYKSMIDVFTALETMPFYLEPSATVYIQENQHA